MTICYAPAVRSCVGHGGRNANDRNGPRHGADRRRRAAGRRSSLARVGVGVVVKDGTPRPDIGSVEAFKRALLAAKSVAYIDPAAGGSSGIYVAGLLDKL